MQAPAASRAPDVGPAQLARADEQAAKWVVQDHGGVGYEGYVLCSSDTGVRPGFCDQHGPGPAAVAGTAPVAWP
jgi:hypothetical protein